MDQSSRQKHLFRILVIVYLLIVSISVICLVIERNGLQFNQRDYNYFIEQAARLTDPNMSKRFATNIEGYNFLGLQGIEGSRSLIQAIHTEYFRYTYVFLYAIFHATLPIYIFYSLVFFLPVLYMAWVPRPHKDFDWKQAALFAMLFILFPATLPAVTSDLRPRMLFIAAWCLVILSVYYKRPFLEKLVMFGFLLFIREEGVLLGAIVILLNFLSMQGEANRWKQTLVFLFMDAVAFALFLAFMSWGGYNRVDPDISLANFVLKLVTSPLFIILAVTVLLVLVIGFTRLKQRSHFRILLILLTYSAAIFLTGTQTVKDGVGWYQLQNTSGPVSYLDALIHMITTSNAALVYYIVILLLVLLPDFMRHRTSAVYQGGLSILCLVFAVISLATFPPQVRAWNRAAAPADLVWKFVDTHDPYQTHVLLDYNTYQAFYRYDHILVYNRLPVWIVWPVLENRFYPQNKDLLAKQIQQGYEYAVVSRGSLDAILGVAKLANLPAVEIASNDLYVILKLK